MALRFILMHDAVSSAIPGARKPQQVSENFAAADLLPLSEELMAALDQWYREKVAPHAHHYW